VSFTHPESKQDVQRFLGVVKYIAKFCSSLSEMVAPLRVLLKSDVEWQWDANSDQIFNKVKDTISDLPVLRLFDPTLENRHQNLAQPLYPVPIPEYPFQKVAADFYEMGGVDYLLVVDFFTKWPCAVPLKTITCLSVITELKRFFIDFAVPEQLVSDNGKQFDSSEFSSVLQRFKYSFYNLQS
jgi:hypothetical protein